MTNGNDFAFNDTATRLLSITEDGIKADNPTLTKREYFAAMAMNGLCTLNKYSIFRKEKLFGLQPENLAENAVKIADAFIAELNKTNQ